MGDIIYLNREYIKYRENLGFNPREPLKYDSEWAAWVDYRDKKWPKTKYKTIAHNKLQLINNSNNNMIRI